MQGSSRRRPISRTGVAAGSVWETRMKMDEVKGGIKVFNGEEENRDDDTMIDEEGLQVSRRLMRNLSEGTPTERKKRKSWRQPDAPAINSSGEKSPIPLRKARSDLSRSPRVDRFDRELGGNKTGLKVEKRVLLIGDGREDGGGDEVELEKEIEIEEERKSFDDKEIVIPTDKQENVDEKKRIPHIHEIPVLLDLKSKPHPEIYHQKKDPIPINPPHVETVEEVFQSTSGAQNQMQNMVDLVMWRDVSKSTLVFGLGTFILLSSSYTKDINFSLISAISYLGLFYLAVIFLYKSILHRGAIDHMDEGDGREMLGEEEAIWVLRLILPYINEVLLKVRAFFSGDPATTMKLAVLLFFMARCGSSITIWTLAKLVFFGIFTIPRVCSSYKVQLARYGKFWLERFRDGWDSCTHKKAVAAAVFTLMWNLSSTIARVWSVFMLVVAVRLYQQRGAGEWILEEEEEEVVVVESREEDSKAGPGHHRQRVAPTVVGAGREVKLKKGT